MTPDLARAILELHASTGMTQQEIAFKVGVNQGRVNEVIKRGKWLDDDPHAPEAVARDKAKARMRADPSRARNRRPQGGAALGEAPGLPAGTARLRGSVAPCRRRARRQRTASAAWSARRGFHGPAGSVLRARHLGGVGRSEGAPPADRDDPAGRTGQCPQARGPTRQRSTPSRASPGCGGASGWSITPSCAGRIPLHPGRRAAPALQSVPDRALHRDHRPHRSERAGKRGAAAGARRDTYRDPRC